MTPAERVKRIRQDIKRIEDTCKSDEVAEACESVRDCLEALDTAIAEEYGPRDEELNDVETGCE